MPSTPMPAIQAGMTMPNCGPTKYTKKTWSSSGVERMNSTVSAMATETSRFGERRTSAKTSPSTSAIAKPMSVAWIVTSAPL